jgi:hypothetical protein
MGSRNNEELRRVKEKILENVCLLNLLVVTLWSYIKKGTSMKKFIGTPYIVALTGIQRPQQVITASPCFLSGLFACGGFYLYRRTR